MGVRPYIDFARSFAAKGGLLNKGIRLISGLIYRKYYCLGSLLEYSLLLGIMRPFYPAKISFEDRKTRGVERKQCVREWTISHVYREVSKVRFQ